jgi:hypothetical protein
MAQKWTEFIAWNFPGGITGVITAAILIAVIVVLSYRLSIKALPSKVRYTLAFIRTIIVILILICLCNPRKIKEKTLPPPDQKKKVAVVFDTSSSMCKKGFSQKNRIQDALNFYNKKIAGTSPNYECSFFQFNDNFEKVENINKLKRNITPIRRTMLFDAISQWIPKFSSEGFDGVICFTDGVDLSEKSPDKAKELIENSFIPHKFIETDTILPGMPYAKFTRLESQTSVKIGSEVNVTGVISMSGLDANSFLNITVKEITKGKKEKNLYSEQLKIKSSSFHSKFIRINIPINEVGEHTFLAELKSETKLLSKVAWSICGLPKEKVKILLYQGGLDWGTRFLRSVAALEKEDFSLDVRFAPGSFGKTNLLMPGLVASFPEQDELEKYDIVIVMKMRRPQLVARVEKNLNHFVKNGGALLFITANSTNAAEYASSPLEKLLPVEFSTITTNEKDGKIDKKTADFLNKMKKYRSSVIRKRNSNSGKRYSVKVPPLTKIKLSEEGKISPIFKFIGKEWTKGKKISLPEFQDFALITREKPGAVILALHPTFTTGDKNRILMAVQQYGKGRTAVLATDPLWSWKLSLDSKDPSYNQFWKQFLGWLAPGKNNKPYWNLPSAIITAGQKKKIELKVPTSYKISLDKLTYKMTKTDSEKLTILNLKKNESGTHYVNINPHNEGIFKLTAELDDKVVAETIFTATSPSGTEELELLKPSRETIETLANTSFSSMQTLAEPFDMKKWLPAEQNSKAETIRKEIPLWNNAWLFILILLLFIADLLIRRHFKLL